MSLFELPQHDRHLCSQMTGVGGILSGWRQRLDPWVKKILRRRKWQPTPGKFHGQMSLTSHSLWSCREMDMTEAHMCTSMAVSLAGSLVISLKLLTVAWLTLALTVLTSHWEHSWLSRGPHIRASGKVLPQGYMWYVYSSMEPASMPVVSPGWGWYSL